MTFEIFEYPDIDKIMVYISFVQLLTLFTLTRPIVSFTCSLDVAYSVLTNHLMLLLTCHLQDTLYAMEQN
jgi:hypothetical protein